MILEWNPDEELARDYIERVGNIVKREAEKMLQSVLLGGSNEVNEKVIFEYTVEVTKK